MMKARYLFFILCILMLATTAAQTPTDSTSTKKTEKRVHKSKTSKKTKEQSPTDSTSTILTCNTLSLPLDTVHKLNTHLALVQRERDSIAQEWIKIQAKNDTLNNKVTELQDSLSRVSTQKGELQKRYEDLVHWQNKTDKFLHNIANHYLNIPYEAYNIKKIAIPAFENIYDTIYQKKRIIKYELLKSYQEDIEAMLTYIDSVEVITKHILRYDKKALIDALHQTSFYQHYQKYEHWKGTFLGKQIVEIEDKINNTRNRDISFPEIRKRLDDCLKTIDDL